MAIPVWRRASQWGDGDYSPKPKNIGPYPKNLSDLLQHPAWRDSTVRVEGTVATVTHRTSGAVARIFTNAEEIAAFHKELNACCTHTARDAIRRKYNRV